MRVFVTGASGFIGSALVSDLIAAGHQVVGLARSDASAAALTGAGAEVRRGTLEDLDSLRADAAEADGVVHLAFNHDFSQHEAAARAELRAIETLGDALEGSDRPLVIADGGPVGSEQDALPASPSPRIAGARAALALAERGVRSSIVRLAPTVHDRSTCVMVAQLAGIAREKGVSGYLGDGSNRWPSVHRLDAARLFRLAVEKAPAGSVLHGVGEEGVTIRAVAEVIGRHVNVPVTAVTAEDAGAHFGFLAGILGLDRPASNTLTRELLGWQPTHPGLLDDLDHGHYSES
ncbi:SDR family oxidoreductase [Kitasatospora atroaurantiaca]|uniref:Nucleoside-diphosphate-sugar epimerase n=1 Tax=Kitasatospora atroaurantiaca TaxID=285545 RepID=A0A561F1U7_9ACTN|nr:SDR family oxidoreductase [Kitasatospora atroaurantiaca]TWE21829.1 nucleoside-diphosphate-sugar epimerase [Kitasatospora atroaurantiaca]